jgi:hypothetical protein
MITTVPCRIPTRTFFFFSCFCPRSRDHVSFWWPPRIVFCCFCLFVCLFDYSTLVDAYPMPACVPASVFYSTLFLFIFLFFSRFFGSIKMPRNFFFFFFTVFFFFLSLLFRRPTLVLSFTSFLSLRVNNPVRYRLACKTMRNGLRKQENR